MPRKNKSDKAIDFEKAIEELESLINKMEGGELNLDESLVHFEQGVKLTRQCQQALQEAEQKVSILMEKDDNNTLTDFNHS